MKDRSGICYNETGWGKRYEEEIRWNRQDKIQISF